MSNFKEIVMLSVRRLNFARIETTYLTLLTLALLSLCAGPALAQAPGANDWITVNKNFSSHRYVDLDQITPKNVDRLGEVCELDLNEPGWFSSGILKVDSTLYFTTRRMTFAVDARTCHVRWRYINTEEPFPANSNNRGLAYLPGKDGKPDLLFRGTSSGHMLAINADNGQVVWNNPSANPIRLESIIAAPVAHGDKVFVGIATADLGVCGRVMAFNAYTGQELWRYYTVPIQADLEGNVTCEPYAGGAQWTSLTLDPEEGRLYVPVSNPNPDYIRREADKDALFTNAVVALDTDTGERVWYYQAVPADDHDWDLGTAPVLFEVDDQKLLAVAGKNGYAYIVDRTVQSNEYLFRVAGTPMVNTDKPFPLNTEHPPNEDAVRVCPGSIGGAQFTGPSHDPERGAFYVGMNEFCWFYYQYEGYVASGKKAGHLTATDFTPVSETTVDATVTEKEWSTEGGTKPDLSLGNPPRGFVTAFDALGEMLWQYKTPAQVQAGTVATKGGVVFAADTLGFLYAFDAKSGEPKQVLNIGGAVNSGLISYEVGGKQYVAAEVGGLSLNPPGIVRDPVTNELIRPLSTLRLKIFTLDPKPTTPPPTVGRVAITYPRWVPKNVPPAAKALEEIQPVIAGDLLYSAVCVACHGQNGAGSAYPTLKRQSVILTDYDNLTEFFETITPPMPKLYPGLLSDEDIGHLVAYFTALEAKGVLEKQVPYKLPFKPDGPGAWPDIYSVMVHPRCINCHTMTDYPRQEDVRHPHFYGVVRGSHTGLNANRGSAVRRCTDCHGDQNNPDTGVPGAENWHLAPLEFAWESEPNVAMDSATLCHLLKQNSPDLESTLEHLRTPLVEWSFNPGNDLYGIPRTTPPLTHEELLEAVTIWFEEGQPCPPLTEKDREQDGAAPPPNTMTK